MNEAGDRREAGRRWDAAESQPISMTEKALVARIYALFDCFYDQLSEEHEQMRRARMLRARRPDEQSRTAPPGRGDNKAPTLGVEALKITDQWVKICRVVVSSRPGERISFP